MKSEHGKCPECNEGHEHDELSDASNCASCHCSLTKCVGPFVPESMKPRGQDLLQRKHERAALAVRLPAAECPRYTAADSGRRAIGPRANSPKVHSATTKSAAT